jgi:hypothetical protein
MPTVLPQLDNDSILLMYHAGELSAEDAATVERMLANDADLRVELDKLRAAYDGAAAALDEADARERVILPAATAARRVGNAARAWHARRAADPSVGIAAASDGRRLRFPWWCYPLASTAATILAAVAWWGFQPDTGPGKRFAPIDSGIVMDDGGSDGDRDPSFAASGDDAIVRTWENYVAVTGADEPAEVNLDEAEEELFAMLEPGQDGADDVSAIFYSSETDEQ